MPGPLWRGEGNLPQKRRDEEKRIDNRKQGKGVERIRRGSNWVRTLMCSEGLTVLLRRQWRLDISIE
jgi:hypothetical protein